MGSTKKTRAAKKGGRKAAKASRACKGLKGRAFHACRKKVFKKMK